MKYFDLICCLLGCLAALLDAPMAQGAVLYVETFTGSAPGTFNGRDGTFSTVGYSGTNNFEGSFAAQTIFSPEVDAIRITESTFFQNYATVYGPTYTTFNWTLDFIAQDIAPSTFNIYFGNATDTFLYSVALTPVIGLNSFTINLSSGNWIGGPGSYSSYNLSSMTYIDIQYSRNGTGAQQFFLDNMALNGFEGGGGGGGGAVPEPNTLVLVAFAGVVLLTIRRRLQLQRASA